MFYGGFGTNFDQARPVMTKFILLSSFGTIFTALSVVWMLMLQIVLGVGFGFVLAHFAFVFMKKYEFCHAGLDTIFMVAVAV